jgi:hypothetical protein
MIDYPAHAQCYCLQDDGAILTIRASRRPRANRAEVKCAISGQAALGERVQEVVRLARHTEARYDSREQVLISIDPIPVSTRRDWELAVVLADRMVRGLYQPGRSRVFAQGCSDHWHLGRINPIDESERGRLVQLFRQAQQVQSGQIGEDPLSGQACLLVLGAPADGSVAAMPCDHAGQAEILSLGHLAALQGHPDPAGLVSSSRSWFPLHSGGVHDSLNWVEVSVYPLAQTDPQRGEEDTIAVPGLGLTQQLAVRQVLAAARQFDPKGEGRWRSIVHFGQSQFQGDSYQLALVMADRIARGRDFAARGRLIASGCSNVWHSGQVQTVEGCAAKCALIMSQLASGDRILLPKAWQQDVPHALLEAVRQQGATLACIERIGFF